MNWLIAGLAIGPLLYILITLFGPKLRSVADYQYGERNLNPSDVVDASIMYGMQVAAVLLFATWGFLYGLTALIIPIFWALGYVLFNKTLSDQFLTRFATDSRFRTLHGFLADHGRVRSVRIFAAILTLISLAGPAMVEAFAVGRMIGVAVPAFGPAGGVGLALAFLSISLIYMTRSGFPGVVRLNQVQMTLGYGGFCASIAGVMILFRDIVPSNTTAILSLAGLISALCVTALKIMHDINTRKYLRRLSSPSPPPQTLDLLGLSAVGVAALSFMISGLFSLMNGAFSSNGGAFPAVFGGVSSFGFTALATLSLFMANAFYQFVDVTQWQRLLSLSVDRERFAETSNMFRSNILTGGLCSALTWVIAIIFGFLLRALFPEPTVSAYDVLPTLFLRLLESGSGFAGPLIFLFVAALVAIMFSTLDALVAATAFTVQEDLLGIESVKASLLVARAATIFVVFVQLLFYLVLSEASGDRIDAVLYICWSFQLAMLPVVAGLIFGRAGSYPARITSMAAGCVGALIPLMYGSAEDAYEISPTAAIVLATAAYLVCGGGRRQSEAVP